MSAAAQQQQTVAAAPPKLPRKHTTAGSRSAHPPLPVPPAAVADSTVPAVCGPVVDTGAQREHQAIAHHVEQTRGSGLGYLAPVQLERQPQQQQPDQQEQQDHWQRLQHRQPLVRAESLNLQGTHDQQQQPRHNKQQRQQEVLVPQTAIQLCCPAVQDDVPAQAEQQLQQVGKPTSLVAVPYLPQQRQQQQQDQLQAVGHSHQHQLQQKQQYQGVELLQASPGITYIKDPSGMQQLIATLAAADSWSFSLHLDPSDPTLNPDAAKKQARAARKQTSNSRAADRSKTAAVSTAKPTSSDRTCGKTSAWRWSVLGVAFSTAEGCAWYVPVTTGDVPGDVAMRSATSSRLRAVWDGLRTIFGSRGVSTGGAAAGADCGSSSKAFASCTKVPAVAAAAAACTPGALAAATATDNATWLSPRPVKVTYALKSQLLMLANPPADSDLMGISVQGCVIDVRIAAWLLSPDCGKVQESSWTGHHGAM